MTILTHCNAGSLSAIWFGTATAPIFQAFIKGKDIKVRIDETRPWLQGARLTAWEMERVGIDYSINIDSAVGYLMSHGLVDMVIVGADHIASNGDTANKIGTYPLALMAYEWKIPFYVAAVSATIDFSLKTGAEIKIEERSGDEILRDIRYKYQPISPRRAKSFNPVFDVTPNKLITGIITEHGISRPHDLKRFN
jgi:methylthioribose-1-phosphate isomerase